jgi:hypothetical protein
VHSTGGACSISNVVPVVTATVLLLTSVTQPAVTKQLHNCTTALYTKAEYAATDPAAVADLIQPCWVTKSFWILKSCIV